MRLRNSGMLEERWSTFCVFSNGHRTGTNVAVRCGPQVTTPPLTLIRSNLRIRSFVVQWQPSTLCAQFGKSLRRPTWASLLMREAFPLPVPLSFVGLLTANDPSSPPSRPLRRRPCSYPWKIIHNKMQLSRPLPSSISIQIESQGQDATSTTECPLRICFRHRPGLRR